MKTGGEEEGKREPVKIKGREERAKGGGEAAVKEREEGSRQK